MLTLAVFASVLVTPLFADHQPFEVIFEWNSIDYNWPSNCDQEQSKVMEEYVAANNAITGLKLWKNMMYLTIPRLITGVPVTLAVTPATPVDGDNAPLLEPYPDWKMQRRGDCSAFQTVQSMEIDPQGRMWVLDSGKTETMTSSPTTKCPPRLVILDLENRGHILRSHVFPEDVAPRESAYLNDIVLDHDDGGWAYITDSGDYGLIVYSLRDNTSWKVRHEASMAAQSGKTPIDGVALSPPGPDRVVYYTPLSSYSMYSIPVSVLRNPSLSDVGDFFTEVGRKNSTTDGMVMTNQGLLYLGLLDNDAIAVWDSTNGKSFSAGLTTVMMDARTMQWPDTFAIDEEGQLWCDTNKMNNFMNAIVNLTEPNYRVLRSQIRAKSYQYFENGTVPDLPEIIAHSVRYADLPPVKCLTL